MSLPRFIKENLYWQQTLQSQIATRTLSTDNSVLLGTTGSLEAVIERVHVQRTGDNVASVLLFFTKKATGAKVNYQELQIPELSGVTAATAIPTIELPLPSLLTPVGGKGLSFGANLEVWVALSVAIASPVNVFFSGGFFNDD